MNRANYLRGRALGVVAWGLLTAISGSATARAQSAEAGSNALDPAAPSASSDLDREISRAETLFRQGEAALSEGRDADARAAFDGALDVFTSASAAEAADPRLLEAYRSLVERITAAEVTAAARRPPVTALKVEIAPPPASAASAEPPSSTLAELGARIEALTPTEEARQTNEAVLGREEIDLPIELNDQVLGAIDLYTGRFNKWFSAALSRGLPHLPRIREILAEAGIPQDLAYVPIVESAFNPSALSRAKAKGLWQFIPSTGKQYGLKQDFFIDERSSVEKATVAAAQYLKNLYAMFGDWNLALAGYNAGEGNVQRAIRRAQTSDFWALAKTRSFRAETKNYVPLIHAAIVIAKSPESYGINVAPEDLVSAETVRVAGSYPISTVARCAGAEPGDIRQLNPELRRGMTPSSAFDLKVPHGAAEQVTACLATEKAMNYVRHVVRKRDTFSLIARMFGVSAAEIARVNGLTLQSRLRPGTELAIPRPPRTSPAKVAAAGKGGVSADTSYRIRKGDTLSSVAARHSTTVEAIKALNGLSSSRLSIGQVLRVASAANESSPE
ncbi:MAG: transglycosylase SLT domain-containing protein [Vicinamibacteria bacterium]|nr:transglycosylase SLT domain-containing protein [Vicinamibacteria bacterium]